MYYGLLYIIVLVGQGLITALRGDITQPVYSSENGTITPVNTRHYTNVDLMLGQRRRRWPNIRPTLVQSVGFS